MSKDINVKTLDIDAAKLLRKEALAMLEQARTLDGLIPMAAVHSTKYGSSTYIVWTEKASSELLGADDVQPFAECEIEIDDDGFGGESLEICPVTLNELSGSIAYELNTAPVNVPARPKD